MKAHLGHGYQPRIEQVPSLNGTAAHVIFPGCTCGWKGKVGHLTNREAWQEHVKGQETHA